MLDPATAAGAIVGQAALQGRNGSTIAIVATNAQVRNTVVTQAWKLNNSALKFFRDTVGETSPGFESGPVELTGSFVHQIGVLVKQHDGTDQSMDYWWTPGGATTPWSWMQMLMQLPQNRFDEIVGPHHICRITLEHVPGSTDQKRCNAAIKCHAQEPIPKEADAFVWDFHVLTSNGEVHRFHPDYTKKKAGAVKVLGLAPSLPQGPAAGRGLSDGPGTFRRISDGNYNPVVNIAVAPPPPTPVGPLPPPPPTRPVPGAPPQSTVVEAIEDGHVSSMSSRPSGASIDASIDVGALRPDAIRRHSQTEQNEISDAIEEGLATIHESTVVEPDKAGKGVAKGEWLELDKAGEDVDPDKAVKGDEQKPAVDKDTDQWRRSRASGSSASSSSSWEARGWNSGSDWGQGWSWQSGWQQ